MSADPQRPSSVYRYWPWLALVTVVALLVLGAIARIVIFVIETPSVDSAVKAFIMLVPLIAFQAFLVLSHRIRTVVDDTGVTQHWITRSYRMPYSDITDLEPANPAGGWYLRVYCGERTYETIPCLTYMWLPFSVMAGPPGVMVAAQTDIEARWSALRANRDASIRDQ